MSVLMWAVLAVSAGLLVTVLVTRRVPVPGEPIPPDESLPSTPLQRLARRCLALGLTLSAAAGGWVAVAGPGTFQRDPTVRIGITLLLVVSLAVFAYVGLRAGRWARSGALDERERAILDRAPLAEGGPMIVTLAAWLIGLQEVFWAVGQVPAVYLYLIFWSVLLVKGLALPVGILVGFRRS